MRRFEACLLFSHHTLPLAVMVTKKKGEQGERQRGASLVPGSYRSAEKAAGQPATFSCRGRHDDHLPLSLLVLGTFRSINQSS